MLEKAVYFLQWSASRWWIWILTNPSGGLHDAIKGLERAQLEKTGLLGSIASLRGSLLVRFPEVIFLL